MDIIGNISGYFEEVETTREYDGYWYCVKDMIVISILGSLCGLRNMIMIVEWAKSAAVTKFLQEKMRIPRVPKLSFAQLQFAIHKYHGDNKERIIE